MTHPAIERPVVARLLIYEADRLHRVLELGGRGLRIGRGAQNDLVLDDPDRTISRFHAELRPEGDRRFVLVDLNSQNGTWVDGQRVDRVELRAGLPVVIGPYRLVLEDAPPFGG